MTTWVLLAGLPATGKSTLAGALGRRLDAVTLDKDRIRDAIFPGPLTDYTREQDDLCMRAILDAATYLTHRGRARILFLDGRTFSRRQQLEEVLGAAERAGAAWRILHLTCTDEVAEARLARADPAHPARNREIALYLQLKQTFEPIPYPKFEIDTTLGIEAKLDAVQRYLETARDEDM